MGDSPNFRSTKMGLSPSEVRQLLIRRSSVERNSFRSSNAGCVERATEEFSRDRTGALHAPRVLHWRHKMSSTYLDADPNRAAEDDPPYFFFGGGMGGSCVIFFQPSGTVG